MAAGSLTPMTDTWPRRLKRIGWACADVAFHVGIVLVLVVFSILKAAWDEFWSLWRGLRDFIH